MQGQFGSAPRPNQRNGSPAVHDERLLERRLTAILAADVTGYSRLIGIDEEETHIRLKELLRPLVSPKVGGYRGRIFKTTGDGVLVEFSSVVDALRCKILTRYNIGRPTRSGNQELVCFAA